MDMDMDSYAWLIYILTFLLTFSIFFIFVLIIVKCVQTCIETRIFCFRKTRTRTRTRTRQTQGTMSSDSDSDENDDFDDEDDSSNSDDDTSSNEYNMRGPPLREISIVSVVDHSSVFAGGYENHAFSPDHEIANNRSRSSIINRKYDDIARYKNGKQSAILTKACEKNQPSRVSTINQISSISNSIKYPNLVGCQSKPSTNRLTYNSALNSSPNILPSILAENQNGVIVCNESNTSNSNQSTVVWVNEPMTSQAVTVVKSHYINESQIESDPDLATDDEIPPPYEQVINESTL